MNAKYLGIVTAIGLSLASIGLSETYKGEVLCPSVGSFSSSHIPWHNFKVAIEGSLDPKTWKTTIGSEVEETTYSGSYVVPVLIQTPTGSVIDIQQRNREYFRSTSVPQTFAKAGLLLAQTGFALEVKWPSDIGRDVPSVNPIEGIVMVGSRSGSAGTYYYTNIESGNAYSGECEFTGNLWKNLPGN